MRRIGLLVLVVSSIWLIAWPARADDRPGAEDLVASLADEDAIVRREAARALLRLGFPAEEALSVAVRGRDEGLRQAAGRLGRCFSLARRLAEGLRGEGGPWLALEAALEEVDPALLDDVLALGLDGPVKAREVRAERERARSFVVRFVRDWNEHYELGSAEERRYAALREELVGTGAAGVPHLLRVLSVDPARTFLFTDPAPPGQVSARMQVRAIFGVAFLQAKEALPYLLVHARGPSLTASTNAGAAFAVLAGLEDADTGLFAQPDLARMDAWWAEHRTEHHEARRHLERALLAELHRLLAREVLRVPEAPPHGTLLLKVPGETVYPHARMRRLAAALALVSGVEAPALAPETPARERLDAIRAYGERLALAR